MKAYIDIEQSKKLAEILPFESADMKWFVPADDEGEFIEEASLINDKTEYYLFDGITDWDDTPYIPCWSLAALLDNIPKEVEIKGQRYAPCLFPIMDGHWLYKLWYNSNEIIESPIGVYCDNPIDACYEMIIKLHELKML